MWLCLLGLIAVEFGSYDGEVNRVPSLLRDGCGWGPCGVCPSRGSPQSPVSLPPPPNTLYMLKKSQVEQSGYCSTWLRKAANLLNAVCRAAGCLNLGRILLCFAHFLKKMSVGCRSMSCMESHTLPKEQQQQKSCFFLPPFR